MQALNSDESVEDQRGKFGANVAATKELAHAINELRAQCDYELADLSVTLAEAENMATLALDPMLASNFATLESEVADLRQLMDKVQELPLMH